jgi:hypothetical protein
MIAVLNPSGVQAKIMKLRPYAVSLLPRVSGAKK